MIERIEVNLLPAEYRIHSVNIKFHKVIVIPSVIVIAIVIFLLAWSGALTAKISSYNRKIADVEAKIAKNQHVLDEINKLIERERVVQTKIKSLERIDVNREKWFRLMEVFCQKIPQGSWLVSMKDQTKGAVESVVIVGSTYSFSEVAQYMIRLSQSEYISSVDLSKIDQQVGTIKTFSFEINCVLNQDVKLGKN